MVLIEGEIVIKRLVEEVFDFVADERRDGARDRAVDEAQRRARAVVSEPGLAGAEDEAVDDVSCSALRWIVSNQVGSPG
jgi:hypothetical protein